MGYPDYERDLLAPEFEVDRVLDRYFHCGQSVVFYGAPPDAEPYFKNDVARASATRLVVDYIP